MPHSTSSTDASELDAAGLRAQLADVQAGIGRLSEAAEIVHGGAESPREGCFVSPTILRASDADQDVLHELEVFGPVFTLIPYDGRAERAAELVNRGGGGLVVSAYFAEDAWGERFVVDAAPYQGRIWMGSERMAEQALPPGNVARHLTC